MRPHSVFLLIALLAWSSTIANADDKVDIIDLYGVGRLKSDEVLNTLRVKVGDPMPKSTAAMVERLKLLPGVKRASVQRVRVALQRPEGGTANVLYVGLDDGTRPQPALKPVPTSDAALPIEIFEGYQELMKILSQTLGRGDVTEDISQGYSLMVAGAGSEIQSKLDRVQNGMIQFADESSDKLIEVLNTAKDNSQRAAAVWIIGYCRENPTAIEALCAASHDADSLVRNNAMRVIGAKMMDAQTHPERAIKIPADIFIEMLDSLSWTDRNKGMMVLLGLPTDQRQKILIEFRETAVPALAEMARWKYDGHALMAYGLLGSAAGINDEELYGAWGRGEKEQVIAKALESACKTDKSAE